MNNSLYGAPRWVATLLFAGIGAISALHYATPAAYMWLHPVYARAYYIPLLLMAVLWGWRAGLAAAFVASAMYAPHVVRAWAGEHEEYMVSQFLEMGMFFVVTGIAGVLADYERRQRRKIEETANQLSNVNRQLQESFEQLRRAERLSALGELAAGLAHEIRNPLGSIEGALHIVSRTELPEPTRREFRDLAQGEVERLKGLVSNFLDFARPKASPPSPTSPLNLLQSVKQLTAESASFAGISVRTQGEAELPDVMLDAQQIKQVLLNLAINSVQAMPDGGNLLLRASATRGLLIFEVEDEGVGVPEEHIEKIFDPFFTTRANGTGLGLSIAGRIVAQQGGHIRARRNPGRGMTFAVELPLDVAYSPLAAPEVHAELEPCMSSGQAV